MKILPITNIYIRKNIQSNKSNDSNSNKAKDLKGVNLLPTNRCDLFINFKRTAKNGEPLRKLLKYKIPDMYTGQIMLDPELLENLLKRKLFSQSISNIVKVLKPYEESLLPIPKKIFEKIEKISAREPYVKLDVVLHRMVPMARKKLANMQRPIFEKLSYRAMELPEKPLYNFRTLMEKTKNILENKPITEDFDPKDFKYKLSRIAKEIRQRGIDEEIKVIEKLIYLSKQFPNEKKTLLQINRNKKTNYKNNKQKTNKILEYNKILQQMNNIFMGSSLYNNQLLKKLFFQAKTQIYEIPITIPFSRKVFIRKLKEITENIKDKKLANDLLKIAHKLPTSQQEVAAFIMKYANNDSEKIGYELLQNSVGTVEHIVPAKKGGKDTLDNYGLLMSVTNSERAHRDINTQLRLHPEIFINCQKYIDRLIDLHKEGLFEEVGLKPYYIEHFRNLMYKLTKDEEPMILDISRLN